MPTKDDLRRAALARRDALPAPQRAAAAAALAARPFPVAVTTGTVVAGFAPIRSEIDPGPLLRALATRGVLLALPRMIGRHAPLRFHRVDDAAALVAGPLGIREPAADAPVLVPDILLVPLAAFDRVGHRLGYGAGYYDRTLAKLRARRPVIAIGVAFAAQEVDVIPADPHDEQLDFVATERETLAFPSTGK